MTRNARYDTIADWYPGWVGDGEGLIAEGVGGLLPPTVRGARVLDVACGHGRASRGLARLGAHVVGVDISAELIGQARAREAAQPLGIIYHSADVADTDQWWDGSLFDGAVCIEAGFYLERAVEPPAPVPTILLLGCGRGPAPAT